LRERTNARHLKPGDLPSGISFVSMDVSFISATLVLPAVLEAVRAKLGTALDAVILIKPQFEAGREHVGKGGIVRDPAAHQLAVDRVRSAAHELGASVSELADSPILGAKGNREFLLYVRF
jgi:23S rRNA (cytidine1920-2'-O)/16S rRNA (cytidine1409-2'-O)-methyltransferase